LHFLIEIALFLCIIYLVFYISYAKKQYSNAILNLKDLESNLIKKESEFASREQNLQQTIYNLQSSFTLEQESISEQKIDLKNKEEKLLTDLSNLETRLQEEVEAKKKVVSQKKSSEVRLGGIAETLAPFLDQFEFDPENCTFLGKPIDYISFGDDEITFIEVKSGNSQLNSKQRYIRDQVKSKLVKWKEIRIK